MDVRAGEQQRPLHDAPETMQPPDRRESVTSAPLAVVMDHLRRRGDLGIGPDRPLLVVQVELWLGLVRSMLAAQ